MGIYPTEGLISLLEYLRAGAPLLPYVGLFLGPGIPRGDTKLADIPEASFPGYVRQPIFPFTPPFITPQQTARMVGQEVSWTMTGTGPQQDVTGWFLVITSLTLTNRLLLLDRFNKRVKFHVPGDQLILTVPIGDGSFF